MNYVQRQPESEPEPLTLGRLFDIYGREVTPTKAERTQKHDQAATKVFLDLFGRSRDPASLSKRDWARFIRERSAGIIGPSRAPVSARTVERDLRFLMAVLNWAAGAKDDGRLFLERNPLKGLRPPTEKNPLRVVLTEAEYLALLEVSTHVDWRFLAEKLAELELDVETIVPANGRPVTIEEFRRAVAGG